MKLENLSNGFGIMDFQEITNTFHIISWYI